MTRDPLSIGLAQIGSVAGDFEVNLERHVVVIEQAAAAGVGLLIFPELSLTGYEPSLAAELALSPNDPCLTPLIEAAKRHELCVVVGLPLVGHERPQVGALIVSANGEVSTYAKRHLHPGEEATFESGEKECLLEFGGERVAIAICADTNAPEHAEQYAELGATVYLAGVLITAGGYVADTGQMAQTAERHGMLVGMANHNAASGGMMAIGKSGFWTVKGILTVADDRDALVIATRQTDGWRGQFHRLDPTD